MKLESKTDIIETPEDIQTPEGENDTYEGLITEGLATLDSAKEEKDSLINDTYSKAFKLELSSRDLDNVKEINSTFNKDVESAVKEAGDALQDRFEDLKKLTSVPAEEVNPVQVAEVEKPLSEEPQEIIEPKEELVVEEMKDHVPTPEKNVYYKSWREYMPRKLHGAIDRFEAKNLAKKVDAKYAELVEDEATLKRLSVEYKHFTGIKNSSQAEIIKTEHKKILEKYEENRKAFEGFKTARDETVERVKARVDEKLNPHKQKLLEFEAKQKTIQEEIDVLTPMREAFRNEIAKYEQSKSASKLTIAALNKNLTAIREKIQKKETALDIIRAKTIPLRSEIAEFSGEKIVNESFSRIKENDYKEKEELRSLIGSDWKIESNSIESTEAVKTVRPEVRPQQEQKKPKTFLNKVGNFFRKILGRKTK